MKMLKKLSILASLLLSMNAFSSDPIVGSYGDRTLMIQGDAAVKMFFDLKETRLIAEPSGRFAFRSGKGVRCSVSNLNYDDSRCFITISDDGIKVD